MSKVNFKSFLQSKLFNMVQTKFYLCLNKKKEKTNFCHLEKILTKYSANRLFKQFQKNSTKIKNK